MLNRKTIFSHFVLLLLMFSVFLKLLPSTLADSLIAPTPFLSVL